MKISWTSPPTTPPPSSSTTPPASLTTMGSTNEKQSTTSTIITTIKGFCNRCGKADAHRICPRCGVTSYCSKACYSWDWKKGGHKSICEELTVSIGTTSIDTMREIILDLIQIENQWLSSLSNDEKRIVVGCVDDNIASRYHSVNRGGGGGGEGSFGAGKSSRVVGGERFLVKKFEPKNYSCVGKIALVLLRVNPCLHVTYRWDTSGYSRLYYNKVLQPWYNKHQLVLNAEGFKLHWATNRDINSDGPLLKDKRNPLIESVNTIFPRPSKCSKNILGIGDEAIEQATAAFPVGMQCLPADLQYKLFDTIDPCSGPRPSVNRSQHDCKTTHRDSLDEWDHFNFLFIDTSNCFLIDRIGRTNFMPSGYEHVITYSYVAIGADLNDLYVPFLHRTITPDNIFELGVHFCVCREAMEKVGFKLRLDLGSKVLNNWGVEKIFICWLLACRCNPNCLLEYLENIDDEVFFAKDIMDESRYCQIKKVVKDYSLTSKIGPWEGALDEFTEMFNSNIKYGHYSAETIRK